MRVAMITPHYRPMDRGNAVTVERLCRNLRELACSVDVYGLDEWSGGQAVEAVTAGRYDLCHAFHACRGGVVAREIARRSGMPYLITLTGSDVYEALADARRKETLSSLASASLIVAFHADIAARLAGLLPGQRLAPVAIIPQGVELPDVEPLPSVGEEFVFLLPAGLRPVKDVLSALSPLAALHAVDERVRLRLVGPVIDRDYAEAVLTTVAAYPFVRCLGPVDHSAMAGLYLRSHVVLNTSRFEGGMANSLLEAMAWGRPVLASDIEGNRSLITDGVNGLLYRDEREFVAKAEMLLTDTGLCDRLGTAGRDAVSRNHAPVEEAAKYLGLYRSIIEAK